MDTLIRYGFSIEEINNMMNSNQEINEVNEKDIQEILQILENVGCGVDHIKNIFIANPFVLTREINEIKKLIVKLLDIGINEINYLFDTNPFLLNIDYKEIDSIVKRLGREGKNKEEIIDYFYFESEKEV